LPFPFTLSSSLTSLKLGVFADVSSSSILVPILIPILVSPILVLILVPILVSRSQSCT
jgi:hypothetical protein